MLSSTFYLVSSSPKLEDAFGVVGLGRERVLEEVFQEPAQLRHQVVVGASLDRVAGGLRDADRGDDAAVEVEAEAVVLR